MKPVLLLAILAWVFPLFLNGQSVIHMNTDELFQEFAAWNNRDTTRRVDVLNELAFRFRNNSAMKDTIWLWAEESYKLSRSNGYLKGESDALVRLGLLSEKNGQLEPAKRYYKKALDIRWDLLKNESGSAAIYNNLGNIYKFQKDSVDIGIFYYQKGIEILHNSRANKMKGILLNNLGGLNTATGNFHKAVIHLNQALEIRKSRQDTVGIANTLLNLGDLYQELKNFEKSARLLEEALVLFRHKNNLTGIGKTLNMLGENYRLTNNLEKALKYYNQALNLNEHLEIADLGAVILNKGVTLEFLQQWDQAKDNYESGIKHFIKAKDDNRLALVEYNLGNIYYQQAEYNLALKHYRKAYITLQGLNNRQLEGNVYFKLSASFTETGQIDSALNYNNKYLIIRDSLFEEYQKVMSYDYNLKEAEAEVYKLTIEKEQVAKRNLKIWGGIGFIITWLLLGFALLGFYLNKQKKKIANQKIIELIKEKEVETNYARLEGEEVTRKRIGQELHDDIGSMLATVKMYFSSVEDKINSMQDENKVQYQKANELLDKACIEVRNLSHKMTHPILENFGLKQQLKALAETIDQFGKTKVELATFGFKDGIDPGTEMAIFRMIQEMTTNVIKHAEASKLSIQVNRFDNRINVMVEDNGLGFDLEKLKDHTGIGLKNLATRVEKLNGTLQIDTRLGKGTSIIIDIPIES